MRSPTVPRVNRRCVVDGNDLVDRIHDGARVPSFIHSLSPLLSFLSLARIPRGVESLARRWSSRSDREKNLCRGAYNLHFRSHAVRDNAPSEHISQVFDFRAAQKGE